MPMLASVMKQIYYDCMKTFLILSILLSGFYITTLNIASNELNGLANFYANVDTTTAAALSNQDTQTQINPTDLKALLNSYTNLF